LTGGGGPRRSGRLELTWTNKDWRLLAREDGSWDWVKPSDYRVAEVRLLHHVANVGDPSTENLLIRGDALSALASLSKVREHSKRYVGQVKLAYLDPPFNTQQSFLDYDDALEHSLWLTMMRDRLEQVRELLTPDGSVWVHCDDYEQAHLRIVMDELFGRDNFVASVVWQRQASQSNVAVFAVTHDYILVFARDRSRWAGARNRLPRTAKQDDLYSNPDDDPRGPWTSQPIQARNYYSRGLYSITTPSGRVVSGPPEGRFWSVSEERLKELDADGRVWWGPRGDGVPRIKGFLNEAEGLVPKTWWPHSEMGTTDEAKRESKRLAGTQAPFATPKPERLMRRVIAIASNPGDLVLDPFLGSGTTAAVAHKMGRRWIGIERSRKTVENFALPRLKHVIAGEDSGGITEALAWQGGGGFHVFDVGSSMFEDDEGQIVLADWATNGKLAEATAAQLGFAYDLDPPLSGRKGRSRLAVVDGHISCAVTRLLVEQLDEGELLTVCGTSIDPQAVDELRALRPGSRVRKIPDSLLAEYQESHRWRPRSAGAIAGNEAIVRTASIADASEAEVPS
jgi:adenine-specific DNA-methyltransferase